MYRTIAASFWTDPKVKKLNPSEKLLLLYLITNPHTHVSGIYYLDLTYAASDTGYPINRISRFLDTLSKRGICAFDSQDSVIWVKKMMRYQGRGEKNIRSAAHHLMEDLHHTPLIGEFLAAYPEVKAIVGDRISIGYSEFGDDATPGTRSLNPDPETIILIPAQGRFKNVILSEVEFAELETKFNGSLAGRIEALSEYMASKGKKYKSHYATILAWERKNGANENGHKTKTDRNAEAARRLLSRLDSQNSSSGNGGDLGSHSGGIFGTTTPAKRN